LIPLIGLAFCPINNQSCQKIKNATDQLECATNKGKYVTLEEHDRTENQLEVNSPKSNYRFQNVSFCNLRKSAKPGETPQSKGENQQQTRITHDSGSEN
jgi:hypothetical protein